MFRAFILSICALALAGRVAALQISLAGMTGNITAQQLLQFPSGDFMTGCESNCTTATNAIQACNDDDTCLCGTGLADQIVQCEQCVFNNLVALNERAPDPRVGSNPALAAYATACETAGIVFSPPPALVVAPGWIGPTSVVLNTPATVFAVGFGAVLAGSAIMMLSNI